ncbi:hypothetical protein J14TS2_20800 [Bacillus sp. J14TS2]|uniref:sialidase family protein n=1 Tax=Bacillus sp. J14TS2 TaxID=2807188 RepID=UPI001B1D9C8E|nr:sialidase family protein [Bacillus sp. J14TS2]GIN71605.1 hypothetical protein J14TS2_20800 [Bacillus sp. J14TS2]
MNILKLEKEYIFKDDRPFQCCHASTIVHLPNNEFLAAWFAGTQEGASDVDIWCARKQHGKWSTPYKICGEEGLPHWNPVLFKGNNHILYLYYKVGYTIPKWHTRVIESKDNGKTWSAPKELVPGDIGGRGPVRNKPIILENGNWLAPASIEEGNWDVFVDISRDQGESWESTDQIFLDHSLTKGDGIIQPTLWESQTNKVHMLMRSTEGAIYRSDSEDGGETWSPAYPTPLPNNNSGIDLVKLGNGSLVLIYNPVRTSGVRTPLVLRYSTDNGDSWQGEISLETNEGEYSYPAIISDGNKTYITYTWKRERIVFWKIEWK